MIDERTIYQRLRDVALKCTYIKRDIEISTRGGSYSAVSEHAVISKIRPKLLEEGILPIQQDLEIQDIEGGVRAIVTIKLLNVDQPNDFILVKGAGRGSGQYAEGHAITYAGKFALLKGICLASGDDPDLDPQEIDEVDPECMAAINRVRDLCEKINPDDPGLIREEGLKQIGEAYGRKVESIFAVPMEILEKWEKRLRVRLGKIDTENGDPPIPRYAPAKQTEDPVHELRLKQIVGEAIVKGELNDIDARAAAIAWLGNNGIEPVELNRDEVFNQWYPIAQKKTKGEWSGYVPAEVTS